MKKALCLILTAIVIVSLCACAPSDNDIVGQWVATRKFEVAGIMVSPTICFSPSGGFYAGARILDTGDLLSSTVEYGKWELDGNTIILTYTSSPYRNAGTVVKAAYSNGKIVIDGDEYEKTGDYYD